MRPRRHWRRTLAAAAAATAALMHVGALAETAYFDVTKGAGPHDVAAAPGASAPVYYTAQRSGKLGILDPKSGKVDEVPLGRGSAPHGVVVMPYGPRPRGASHTFISPVFGSTRP